MVSQDLSRFTVAHQHVAVQEDRIQEDTIHCLLENTVVHVLLSLKILKCIFECSELLIGFRAENMSNGSQQ